jgi:hypothetical protein
MVDLGLNGIFISDAAVEKLSLHITPEEFQALKAAIADKDKEEKRKCYLTEQWVPTSEGIFFPPEKMADAIQKTLDSKDLLESEFTKDKIITCICGNKFKYVDQFTNCPYCKKHWNTKAYYKSIHLGNTSRLTFNLLINQLRKNATKRSN